MTVTNGRWIDLDHGDVRIVTTPEGGLEVSVLVDGDDDRVAHEMDQADKQRLLAWLEDA